MWGCDGHDEWRAISLDKRTSEKLCACYKTEVQTKKITKLELNVWKKESPLEGRAQKKEP